MSHLREPGTGSNLRIFLTTLALLLGTALVLSAAPTPVANNLTVGEFAMLVAARTHQADASVAPSTPEAAVASLQRLGIRIRPDLSSPLTEGDALELFRQFGISLQAQAPDNLLDLDRAASLIGIFGANLASAGNRNDAIPAFQTSTSTPGMPTTEDLTPEYCQTLWPLPDCKTQVECNPCMYCCNKLLALNGTVCGHLCQKRNLVVSPDEPTP